ncbi:MAG: PAS domain S-box-containing protein [Candidatus Marinamargulisbacteria bacterium]|jgi:PAS domain S-box-containing protein
MNAPIKKTDFSKKTSLRNKILLPFIFVIAFMAIASVALSIYLIRQTTDKHVQHELNLLQVFLKEGIEEPIEKLRLYTQLLPSIRLGINPERKSDKAIKKEFDWGSISIYTNPSQFSSEQLTKYKALLEKANANETETKLFFFNDKKKGLNLRVASAGQARFRGKKYPVIVELPLNQKLISNQKEAHIGYFFLNENDEERYSELILGSDLIASNKNLQRKLNGLMRNHDPVYNKPFSHQILFEDMTYRVLFNNLDSNKHIYSAILISPDNIFFSKLKVFLATFFVFILISLSILFIYTIIIRKITSSIDILSSVAKKVAKGDLNQQVYVSTTDEIGELSNIFNKMVKNLKDSSANLLREKERSEAIISCIPEGILVTDKENRLILANKNAENMFSFSMSSAKGKFVLDSIKNADLQVALKDEKLVNDQKQISREISIPLTKNKKKTYALISSPAQNRKNENIGIISTFRDTTHERELDELRDGFLRTVSHELRTPLTSVIGYMELVKSGSGGIINKDQESYLQTALDEASNLKNLINDLLDLSQIKAGKIKMHYTKVKVQEMVDNLVHTLLPIARGKGLDFTSTSIDPSLKIKADSGKLRRILLNLISNAIKFTDKGIITISCKENKHDVEFSIADTGIGLLEEEKESIFEKFRQVDYSSTRQYDGIGLGLSIVKQLVEMHKGKIWVDSEYGKGTTFKFSIKK